MKYILRTKIAYSIVSIFLIILGAYFVLFPDASSKAVCYSVGALTVLFGIVKLIGYFSRDVYRLAFQFDFALGLVLIVCGLVTLLRPSWAFDLLSVMLGIFVLVDGVFKIQTSLDSKNFGMKKWWVILLLGILTGVGGLLLFLEPFILRAVFTVLLGITLIVDGIQNLWVVLYTVRARKSIDDKD